MRKQWVVTGWMTAAAVAVASGVGAVALAQGGTLASPAEPMSTERVEQALGEAESASPGGAASPTPGPSGEAPSGEAPSAGPSSDAQPSGQLDEVPSNDAGSGEQVLGGRGGTFLASCDGGLVTLEWWTPAQGWHVDGVDEGPDEEVEVEFESSDAEVEYTVVCEGGEPRASAED